MSADHPREVRERWARAARGWEAHAEHIHRTTLPVSARMVEALRLQPGDTVLDLAAGTGDTGYLAAELIEPGGSLITSDLVPEMLSAAQRRAEALGVRNVRFRQIDAETSIDLPAASIDGVLCRWGYILMADPGTALRETRRILRSGRRVSLAAWAAPEHNPWTALIPRELLARDLLEPADPTGPGQFAWAEEGVIAERLRDAGFADPEVEAVDFVTSYGSVEEWEAITRDMSVRIGDAMAGLDAATLQEVRTALRAAAEPYAAGDGSLAFPARTWVACAEA
jgi:SAM-dependent methyltransferase